MTCPERVCAEYSRADVVLGVRFRTCRGRVPKLTTTKAASKYSELEHLGRLPLEELKVQVASPRFQILDLNFLVP